MFFELIGPITNVETFAVGKKIRDLPRLRKVMVVEGGGSAKELLKFALRR